MHRSKHYQVQVVLHAHDRAIDLEAEELLLQHAYHLSQHAQGGPALATG